MFPPSLRGALARARIRATRLARNDREKALLPQSHST
jgi:hypothetical protein